MKGKNKKLLWFEAGILIVTLMTVSIGSAVNVQNLQKNPPTQPTDYPKPKLNDLYTLKTSVENFLKNPPVQPTGTPWIDLNDSYQADNNGYLILDFYIYYGTKPYTGNITWGDGSPPENYTTPDGHVLIVHKYETCRTEPYRIKVNATDSDNNSAHGETNAFFSCCEVDLIPSLDIDYTKIGYPFVCAKDPVYFIIHVSSIKFFNACICDQYEVNLTVSSPDGAPLQGLYGPIAPGYPVDIKPDAGWKLESGWHTACVTVTPIGCTDIYPGNNQACIKFYVLSQQLCYILKILWDLFGKIINSIFPNAL